MAMTDRQEKAFLDEVADFKETDYEGQEREEERLSLIGDIKPKTSNWALKIAKDTCIRAFRAEQSGNVILVSNSTDFLIARAKANYGSFEANYNKAAAKTMRENPEQYRDSKIHGSVNVVEQIFNMRKYDSVTTANTHRLEKENASKDELIKQLEAQLKAKTKSK